MIHFTKRGFNRSFMDIFGPSVQYFDHSDKNAVFPTSFEIGSATTSETVLNVINAEMHLGQVRQGIKSLEYVDGANNFVARAKIGPNVAENELIIEDKKGVILGSIISQPLIDLPFFDRFAIYGRIKDPNGKPLLKIQQIRLFDTNVRFFRSDNGRIVARAKRFNYGLLSSFIARLFGVQGGDMWRFTTIREIVIHPSFFMFYVANDTFKNYEKKKATYRGFFKQLLSKIMRV